MRQRHPPINPPIDTCKEIQNHGKGQESHTNFSFTAAKVLSASARSFLNFSSSGFSTFVNFGADFSTFSTFSSSTTDLSASIGGIAVASVAAIVPENQSIKQSMQRAEKLRDGRLDVRLELRKRREGWRNKFEEFLCVTRAKSVGWWVGFRIGLRRWFWRRLLLRCGTQ